MALLAAPVVSFITATRTSVAFNHQIAPFADTTEVQLYNVTDNTTDVDKSFGVGSINISDVDGLKPNKQYVAIFQSKDSGDQFSSPVVTLPFFSDFPSNSMRPRVLETTALVQRPDGTVRIPYALCNPTAAVGDIEIYQYSLDGSFVDARTMTPALTDVEHEGIHNLTFDTPEIDHVFIWDAAYDLASIGQPKFIGTVSVRLVGEIGTVQSPPRVLTVDLNLTDVATLDIRDYVVPGQSLTVQHAFFDAGVPFDPATIEITELKDPLEATPAWATFLPITGTQVETGVYSFVLPIDAAATLGTYRYRIQGNTPGGAPFTWQTDEFRTFAIVSPLTDADAENLDITGCLLYGVLRDATNNPLVNVVMSISYSDERESFTNVARRVVSTITDSKGFFAVLALRNTFLHIFAEDFPFSEKIRVPDAPIAEFRAIQTNQPAVLTRDAFGNPI